MKFFRSLSILWISFFLLSGYIALDKNVSSVLFHWKTTSPESYSYGLESLRDAFTYSAENIFDEGYVREVESELYRRLSVYPTNKSLEGGRFIVSANSSDETVKIALPEGFKGGIFNLRVTAKSKYKIGTSFDLKNWEFYDYPGFIYPTETVVKLERKDSTDKDAYLKFLPSQNEGLEIIFTVFQYTSTLPVKEKADYGVLFYPEVDIDYEGKQIIHQGVIYDAREIKTNN